MNRIKGMHDIKTMDSAIRLSATKIKIPNVTIGLGNCDFNTLSSNPRRNEGLGKFEYYKRNARKTTSFNITDEMLDHAVKRKIEEDKEWEQEEQKFKEYCLANGLRY